MSRLNAVKKSATTLLAPLVLLVVVALCAPTGWVLPASAKNQVPKVPDGPAGQVQFQIVHSFGAAGDGVAPGGGLAMDSKGNLYGTTESGGEYGQGTVYELSPGANGQWTETILHSFPYLDPADGDEPIGIVLDSAGNVYGETEFGGDGSYCDYLPYECGVIFELSPGANGQWTETILYNFCSQPDCADGGEPKVVPALTLGPDGSLYGVATNTAFRFTPGSNGWTYTVLYTFCSEVGCNPTSGLILDPKGNLYGEGGTGYCCAIVFELQPGQNGEWNELVLFNFSDPTMDGGSPERGLTLRNGGLYGVAEGGGTNCIRVGGCGAVFELTQSSGNYNDRLLWSFGGKNQAQGFSPNGPLIFDEHGDIFGSTSEGGEGCGVGCGVVYGLREQKNAKWAYYILHSFDGSDGVEPLGGLIRATTYLTQERNSGNLWAWRRSTWKPQRRCKKRLSTSATRSGRFGTLLVCAGRMAR